MFEVEAEGPSPGFGIPEKAEIARKSFSSSSGDQGPFFKFGSRVSK